MSYGSIYRQTYLKDNNIKRRENPKMYQVIDIIKVKKEQDIDEVANHNLRQVPSKNVNSKKTPLNKYLIGSPSTNTLEELNKKLLSVPKFRKDAVKTVNIVLSASPEFFENATKEKIKEWEKVNQKWLENTFGKENIIYSVIHYDEKTPHFHCCIVPIKDGKLNSSYWLDGPSKLNKLHNSLNVALKPFGLKRGQKTEKSTPTEIEDFYKKVNSSTAYDKKLDLKLDEAFSKLENPTLLQKLTPWTVIDEVVKPLLKQLKTNLSHYRTKSKQAEPQEKELIKAKQKIADLELKLETLGIKPDISFIELSKFKAELIIHASDKPLFIPESITNQVKPAYKNKLRI